VWRLSLRHVGTSDTTLNTVQAMLSTMTRNFMLPDNDVATSAELAIT
jgi:hypothetical protein